ncbi:hypothetical protein E2562_034615 [Oryza meyeriana var. granulata]|uniref:Uncharacterized protein n=1 Tax=Oryza meyeriana var. granulata TaxID=110450 RepID=A0A6G1DSR1_9ORYZ|nr:hypothetical protein E2562_034615 [Oryza meyeriana var. granulata]
MERGQCHGGKNPPPPLAPPRRARGDRREGGTGGSFSASLLDAIYRSLDEGVGGDGGDVADTTRRRSEEGIKTAVPPQFWWAKSKQAAGAGRSRRESAAAVAAGPRHSGYASSATSSSDASSSYSFTCSSASTTDTESTMHRRRQSQPPPLQPEDVDDDADADDDASPNSKAKKKKNNNKKSRPCFPGARLRPRGTVPPPSSGSSPATFACVVKALFTSSRLPRKPKTPTAVPLPQASPPVPQPPCMSATSSSNTKASERRSVRFCPDAKTSVVQRRVEELVRSLADVEENEDGSDASSDLFELESLRGADGDELPVYGTTSLATNRAIAQRGQLVSS